MDIRRLLDHTVMVHDRLRMQAYEAAIRATCAGRAVCEVGVGLGPLSLMALRAGASRVYGIESDADSLALATEVIRANGFDATRFVPVHGVSTRVKLPERVDVVVSETLDSMGVGENTVPFLNDAAQRFLLPGGVIIPAQLDCLVALASPAVYRDRHALWTERLRAEHGMGYELVAERLRRERQTLPVQLDEIYSGWERWQRIDPTSPSSFRAVAPVLFVPEREGEVLGLAFAFDATLANAIHLRTRPDDPPTHWMQGFHAFPKPVMVQPGHAVYAELVTVVETLENIRFEMHVASGPMRDLEAVVRQRRGAFAPAPAPR